MGSEGQSKISDPAVVLKPSLVDVLGLHRPENTSEYLVFQGLFQMSSLFFICLKSMNEITGVLKIYLLSFQH